MFRRLFWFSLGAFAGYSLTVRAQRLIARGERYVPPRVREEVVDTVRLVKREVAGLVRRSA